MDDRSTPHNADPNFARDSQGRILRDRYGRPIRRRPLANPRPAGPAGAPAARSRQEQWAARTAAARQSVNAQKRPLHRPRPEQGATSVYPAAPGAVGPRRITPPATANVPPATALPRTHQPQPPRKPRGGCVGAVVRRALRSLLALVLVVALALGAGLVGADRLINRIPVFAELGANRTANTAGTNWLLVGSDSRQELTPEQVALLGTGGDIGVGRTDTIMVLHLPLWGQPTLLSLPRDSYVSIPGYGQDKLNAAFSYGDAPLLVETVEQATQLHIDHYLEIGFGGFAQLVDALGGVQLCPTEPLADPLANLDVPAGCQKMDGPTALGYVRTRATALGDLDRVARQREFVAAVVQQLARPQTFFNPLRAWGVFQAITGAVLADKHTHSWHLLRAAWALRGGMQAETMPVGGFADTESGNVVLWDEQQAAALLAKLR